MADPTQEPVTAAEWVAAIDTHLKHGGEWDGPLPIEDFFAVWAEIEAERQSVCVGVRVVGGRVELNVAPDSPVQVAQNHIYRSQGEKAQWL